MDKEKKRGGGKDFHGLGILNKKLGIKWGSKKLFFSGTAKTHGPKQDRILFKPTPLTTENLLSIQLSWI